MRAWSLFKSWAGRLYRWQWPRVFVSAELMLMGGKLWARQLTSGLHAGGWQFPPELCEPGKAPPMPYQSPCVSVRYTPRRGKTQSALAKIVFVKRLRYRYAWLPFVVRSLYPMEVVFSEPIGDPAVIGDAVAGVVIECTDPADPVESLLRWMARMRQRHVFG